MNSLAHNAFKPEALTFEAAVARTDAMDLSDIKALMHQHHAEWTDERVDSAILWYRRFLALNAMYPGEPIISTQDVDDVWHTHVLHTKLYFQHCAQVFGYYLHHGPVIRDGRESMAPYAVAFVETLKLCDTHFGERPPMDRVVKLNVQGLEMHLAKSGGADGALDISQMVCTGNGDCAPGLGPQLDSSQMTCFGNGDCAPGLGPRLVPDSLAA